jgi:hypothetical protein
VVYPTGHTKYDRTDGTKKKTAQYNFSQTTNTGAVSRRRGINVDSPRRSNIYADYIRVNDRDMDNIRNADSTIRTDIVPGYMMKTSDNAWLRRILQEGAG